MIDSWPVFVIVALGLFLIGTVVGSFVNLCVARLPYGKSVFWPASRCDACGAVVETRDLVPIVGSLRLGGKARCCGAAIGARQPAVELITGLLFVAALISEIAQARLTGTTPLAFWTAVVADACFLAILVVITCIDYDLTIVPAEATNLGIALGLLFGVVAPGYRPEPAHASTALEALAVGGIGVAVAMGLVMAVRILGGFFFRREAMGLGDVHILGVIGAFRGWQVAVLSFFLSAFYGLLPSLGKLIPYLWNRLTGRAWKQSDREIPLGPFLCLAAATLTLAWPWVWPAFLKPYFVMIEGIVRFLLGLESDF
ncbi:MAG: prepilin peptidase [Isosphaeraceae bacterium]|nr:prepilin peptidase [Isosphaeraceae bacterium]